MLEERSVVKLFRDYFPGKNPIQVGDDEAKEKLGQEILRHLADYPPVDITDRSRDRYPYSSYSKYKEEQLVCDFSMRDPGGWSDRDSFRLFRNDAGLLIIVWSSSSCQAFVSSLDELDALVLEYMRRIERRKVLAAKRKKVQHLKSQAITVRVRQLAVQERFDFILRDDEFKMTLVVKLSDTAAFQLQIPLKKFEQVLLQVPLIVRSLRQAYGADASFRILPSNKWEQQHWQWTSYKDVDV
jgi:hypothetical protein